MKLKLKIFFGFLILALMLSVAGGWSIYQINSFSKTVDEIISDNYESVVFAKKMREALEREDSAILLLLHKPTTEIHSMLLAQDKNFEAALQKAVKNVTLPGEKEIIDKITSDYAKFKSSLLRLTGGKINSVDLNWYFENVHDYFLQLMISIDELASLNNNALYKTSIEMRKQARSALVPGVVAIITAIIFTLMFSYFVNHFMINPIIEITEGMRNFIYKKVPYKYTALSNDEIGKLSETAQALISINQSYEK